MMRKDQIGASVRSALERLWIRRNARGNHRDLGRSRNLETVWSLLGRIETARFEQLVAELGDLVTVGHVSS